MRDECGLLPVWIGKSGSVDLIHNGFVASNVYHGRVGLRRGGGLNVGNGWWSWDEAANCLFFDFLRLDYPSRLLKINTVSRMIFLDHSFIEDEGGERST